VQLSCSHHECCAVRLDGVLLCWGGALGEADIPAMEFGEGEKYIQVAVGREFFCGIKVGRGVNAFGGGGRGGKCKGPPAILVGVGEVGGGLVWANWR
jgi:hypothetical protein